MQIRLAVEADASDIAMLATQLGYPNQEPEILDRLVTLKDFSNSEIYVCDENQRLLGWIQVSYVLHMMSPPFAEVGGLVVAEECRGQGIGKALLNQAEIWAKDHGLASVWIRSNVLRLEAHDFYVKQGYRLIKSQRVFRKDL